MFAYIRKATVTGPKAFSPSNDKDQGLLMGVGADMGKVCGAEDVQKREVMTSEKWTHEHWCRSG